MNWTIGQGVFGQICQHCQQQYDEYVYSKKKRGYILLWHALCIIWLAHISITIKLSHTLSLTTWSLFLVLLQSDMIILTRNFGLLLLLKIKIII